MKTFITSFKKYHDNKDVLFILNEKQIKQNKGRDFEVLEEVKSLKKKEIMPNGRSVKLYEGKSGQYRMWSDRSVLKIK